MEPFILQRYSKPNDMDQWPQGTVCHVLINDKEYDVYIQRAEQEDHPIWECVHERLPR